MPLDDLPCVHYWLPLETDEHKEPIFTGFPTPKCVARCLHCEERDAFSYREWHDIPLALPPYKPA